MVPKMKVFREGSHFRSFVDIQSVLIVFWKDFSAIFPGTAKTLKLKAQVEGDHSLIITGPPPFLTRI
jgi:hypothetical protein